MSLEMAGDRVIPQHVARLLAELGALRDDEVLLDPAGVHAGAARDAAIGLAGIETYLHAMLGPQHGSERAAYSLVVLPLFAVGSVAAQALAQDLWRSTRSRRVELLGITLAAHLLRPGGRALLLLPERVLQGSSKAHAALRRGLIEDGRLDALIRLPAGALRPLAKGACVVLALGDAQSAREVWFYDIEADGYSLDARRRPLLPADKLGPVPSAQLGAEEHMRNNLPDVLARWPMRHDGERERPRSAQSFTVACAEIAACGYELALGSYREPAVDTAPQRRPHELLADLAGLEAEIFQGIRHLVGLLK